LRRARPDADTGTGEQPIHRLLVESCRHGEPVYCLEALDCSSGLWTENAIDRPVVQTHIAKPLLGFPNFLRHGIRSAGLTRTWRRTRCLTDSPGADQPRHSLRIEGCRHGEAVCSFEIAGAPVWCSDNDAIERPMVEPQISELLLSLPDLVSRNAYSSRGIGSPGRDRHVRSGIRSQTASTGGVAYIDGADPQSLSRSAPRC
jgi:hypothetical protein